MTVTLEPGQFMLDDLVFGENTMINVENIDIGAYDVNVQDYQIQGSNEIRFGQDTLKAQPLQLKINVRINRPRFDMMALTGDFRTLDFSDDPNLSDLQRVWRAPNVLSTWNTIMPLYFCGTDGITRAFYGRPGKFGYKKHLIKGGRYFECQGEYRRADTYGYSQTEYFATFAPNIAQTLHGTAGSAPSWFRAVIYGPANVPTLNFGGQQIVVDYNIGADDLIEISTYPWERRVINLSGYSLSSYLSDGLGGTVYLEGQQLSNTADTLISWTGTGTTADSRMVFLFRNGYQVMD